jgi:hypothetical protein
MLDTHGITKEGCRESKKVEKHWSMGSQNQALFHKQLCLVFKALHLVIARVHFRCPPSKKRLRNTGLWSHMNQALFHKQLCLVFKALHLVIARVHFRCPPSQKG